MAAKIAAAAAASQAATSAETGLACQKCQEPTLLKDSVPNGKNALRRNCLECVSTDKWLTRSCKKPKATETEPEFAKEKRQKAETLKASLSKMSPSEKAQWYCKQKEERRKQEKGSKRTFSTGVGYIQESISESLGCSDKDIFETCEDWCARQMTLQKYSTLEEATLAFQQECKQPGAKTLKRRGETLLGRFGGVEVDMSTRHSLTEGIRQRADLHDQDDLEAFQSEAKHRMERGHWRLESDRQAALENTLKQPTRLLNVEGDIQRAQQQDAEMEQMWMEQLEAEAKEKSSGTQKTVAKSAGVEAMGYEAAISRTTQSMRDVLSRQQALLLGAQEETQLLETELLRSEGSERQKECENMLPALETSIDEWEKKWRKDKTTHEKDGNADALHEGVTQVAKDYKEWSTKDADLIEFKAKVKNFRAWLQKSKAQVKKAEKAGAQAKAALQNAKMGNASSWNDIPLVKQMLQEVTQIATASTAFGDKGLAWNFAQDFLDNGISPVAFSRAQGKAFADDMKAHDYFKFQKVWVAEQMRKAGCTWMSALVTKSTVARRLSGTWSKLLGDECEKWAAKLPPQLVEMFQPQFFQQTEKSCSVHLHPDFGLPDVRMCLEGHFFYMGFPMSKLQGPGLASMREDLCKQSWQSFQRLCTWACEAKPGKVVAIPGDHVFCTFVLEDSHGARIHALCGKHIARSAAVTDLLLKDNPILATMRTGKLKEALDESLVQRQSEAKGDKAVGAAAATREPDLKRAKQNQQSQPSQAPVAKAGNFDLDNDP